MKTIIKFTLMFALLFSTTLTFASTGPSAGGRVKARSLVHASTTSTAVTIRRKVIEKCIKCDGKVGDPGVTCVIINCPKT
jgi:hypothetical protein